MGLSDIITTPFLLCLGICFLLIGLLGYYFIQKINEQNHKMNSMLDLITTVANELNHVNGRLHNVNNMGAAQNYQTTDLKQSPNNMLIPVSDDENDDINIGSEDESDNEEEDDDEDDDEDDEDDEEEDNGKSFIKSINIGNVLNFNFDDTKLNEDIVEDLSEDEDEDENYNNNESDINSVSISSEKEGELDSEEQDEEDQPDEEELLEEKTIQISDLEEIKESLKIDYKKFALNKLRTMVIDKGLTSDSSKLKKQDLIKLLEEN